MPGSVAEGRVFVEGPTRSRAETKRCALLACRDVLLGPAYLHRIDRQMRGSAMYVRFERKLVAAWCVGALGMVALAGCADVPTTSATDRSPEPRAFAEDVMHLGELTPQQRYCRRVRCWSGSTVVPLPRPPSRQARSCPPR
jgi:hypothetical protein